MFNYLFFFLFLINCGGSIGGSSISKIANSTAGYKGSVSSASSSFSKGGTSGKTTAEELLDKVSIFEDGGGIAKGSKDSDYEEEYPKGTISEESSDLNSLLFLNVSKGTLEAFRNLVNEGYDINVKDRDGFSLLHYAVQEEREEFVEELIKLGLNINDKSKEDVTSMHLAAELGNINILLILLEKGAEITLDENMESPLDYALDANQQDAFAQIVINIVKRDNLVKIDETLLSYEDRVAEVEDEDGNNLLHLVVEMKREEDIVRYLASLGVDVNKRNGMGETPLILAAKNDNLGAMQILIDLGASINLGDEDDGMTALHHAIADNNISAVKLLVRNNADLNIEDSYGETPSDHLKEDGNENMLRGVKEILIKMVGEDAAEDILA